MDIRLIALDLDGTLLAEDKRLSPRNRAALTAAAAAGAWIVPATGRLYRALPEDIRALPFLRYVITVNGAVVLDAGRAEEETLYAAEIPAAEAVGILRFLDGRDVIYDCYYDGRAFMTSAMKERAGEYTSGFPLQSLRELRTPVPELKAFLEQRGGGVQKIQMYPRTPALRQALLRELPERFPGIVATSSLPGNIELNHVRANKGDALNFLAGHLGLAREQTMAFGDGLNDVSMLRAAGCGVAMGNASPEARAAADRITADNEHDGVAEVIEGLRWDRAESPDLRKL